MAPSGFGSIARESTVERENVSTQWHVGETSRRLHDRAEVLRVNAKAGDMEQMGELINILLGKEDVAFYTFCDLLEHSNYEVWARELKSAAERLKTVGMLNTCCLHIVAELGYR